MRWAQHFRTCRITKLVWCDNDTHKLYLFFDFLYVHYVFLRWVITSTILFNSGCYMLICHWLGSAVNCGERADETGVISVEVHGLVNIRGPPPQIHPSASSQWNEHSTWEFAKIPVAYMLIYQWLGAVVNWIRRKSKWNGSYSGGGRCRDQPNIHIRN